MKQIFKTNLGIKTVDVAVPTPGYNEILVKVKNSLVSLGTETSSMKPKKFQEKISDVNNRYKKLVTILSSQGIIPTFQKIIEKIKSSNEEIVYSPIGYSNSGIIASKGSGVTNFNVGDRVACGGNSFAVHGEYAIIPKNLAVRIPEDVSFQQAAFTTVGSIAMQGIRRAGVEPGETIVIYGLGLIGLIAVQIAKAWGIKVIGIDIDEEKLSLAKQFGSDLTINSTKEDDLIEVILNETNGYGADASIIYASTSGSELVNNSFKFCRIRANIVIVGSVGMNIQRQDFYKKEQNLLISTSYGPGRYDVNYEEKGVDYPIGFVRWTENRNMQEFIRLLYESKIDVNRLITLIENPDNATKVYGVISSNENKNIAVLFEFTHNENEILKNINYVTNKTELSNNKEYSKANITVGLIGIGGYLKSFILPILGKEYNLYAVANKTTNSSLEIANKFNLKKIYGNTKELLSDNNINIVFIGTRHNLHAEMVIDALKNSKNVYVEKPLALKISEILNIKELTEKNGKRVFVGFNRRYSSLTQEIKREIKNDDFPIMMIYRINAGKIPLTSWVQDPVIGGGRIIGEGCHFIDYCNYLVGDDPIDIDIKSMPVDGKTIIAEDNYTLTIKYKNGSLAIIVYTSIGNNKLNKEYVEIYQNGNSYVLDDFERVIIYKGNRKREISLKNQDKGRKQQMVEIQKCLKGIPSLIPDFLYDLNASIMAITAQEILNGKK